jgi:hypothetical protein
MEKLAQNYNLQFGAITSRNEALVKEECFYVYNRETNKSAMIDTTNGEITVIDGPPSQEQGEIYVYELKVIQRALSHETIDHMVKSTI